MKKYLLVSMISILITISVFSIYTIGYQQGIGKSANTTPSLMPTVVASSHGNGNDIWAGMTPIIYGHPTDTMARYEYDSGYGDVYIGNVIVYEGVNWMLQYQKAGIGGNAPISGFVIYVWN